MDREFFPACLDRLARLASRARLLLSLLVLPGLLACVAVPRTASVYDDACQIHREQMVLDMYQVGAFGGCANQGCVMLLVAAGAVTAASVVISGTVVVVGNVVYWFERQGRCPGLPANR